MQHESPAIQLLLLQMHAMSVSLQVRVWKLVVTQLCYDRQPSCRASLRGSTNSTVREAAQRRLGGGEGSEAGNAGDADRLHVGEKGTMNEDGESEKRSRGWWEGAVLQWSGVGWWWWVARLLKEKSNGAEARR
jgi:hypothetical protein